MVLESPYSVARPEEGEEDGIRLTLEVLVPRQREVLGRYAEEVGGLEPNQQLLHRPGRKGEWPMRGEAPPHFS